MAPAPLVRALGLLVLSTMSWSCQRGPAASLVTPPQYEPAGQSKCTVQASATRPLVVEWPSADRASLEARLGRGLVAVRASGCEIEVLRQCAVPGNYEYRGLTRKNDQVLITNADELYAQLPIGAARLEGKLARSGKLDVRMALVGMLEAPAERVLADKLTGDCEGATHVITGVQLGAFEFFAGGSGELGAGVAIGQAGLGGHSEASRELLSADGDPARCDASTSQDARPPEGCGAVIRIELQRLVAPTPLTATCPSGSSWDGERCMISQTYCPNGKQSANGQCIADQPTSTANCAAGQGCVTEPAPAGPPNATLCRDLCQAAAPCVAKSNRAPTLSDDLLAQQVRQCQEKCETWDIDERRASKIRQCFAGGCSTIWKCIGRSPG